MSEEEREQMAHEVHGVYCIQYMINEGKTYWTNFDYSRLPEKVKDFDRALVAWHLTKTDALRKELAESDHALEARQESYSHEWAELVSKLGDAERSRDSALASLAKAKEEVGYLVEQADAAYQFCGKICGHRPTDTIREVESEALALGHGLMIALNPFRSSPASPVEKKEGA